LQKLSEITQQQLGKIRYNKGNGENRQRGGMAVKFVLILGVILTFLSAIFTAGYNDKPGVNK
jgi:hypothetical protein